VVVSASRCYRSFCKGANVKTISINLIPIINTIRKIILCLCACLVFNLTTFDTRIPFVVTVFHYHGCMTKDFQSYPPGLNLLENKIDDIAKTDQWVGRQ